MKPTEKYKTAGHFRIAIADKLKYMHGSAWGTEVNPIKSRMRLVQIEYVIHTLFVTITTVKLGV